MNEAAAPVYTVLVVDDEDDILEVLRLALEHAGYRVLTASNGAEALEVVDRDRPDALLLDVGMPQVDGWEVLERIKSGAPDLRDVPVVMLTAWTSETDRLRGGIEGAVHYLAKPFDPAEVIGVLEALLAPGATPEPLLRRSVQTSSLERLARLEGDPPSGGAGSQGAEGDTTRVHLTRLDRRRSDLEKGDAPGLGEFLDALPARQREVAERVAAGERVTDIAADLDVSRSNVYALLRRVGRRSGLDGGRAVIRHLRRLGARNRG